MQNLSLSVSFLSLSIMSLRFIYVVAYVRISFFLRLNNIPLGVYVYIYIYIYIHWLHIYQMAQKKKIFFLFRIFAVPCSVTQVCLTWPHGQQLSRLPCFSLSPSVCPDSCPLSQWCHLTTSFSDSHFSLCPQSFPASGSFPMSQLSYRWPKYWSFSLSPSKENSGLISFRIE